jgi:hypothetical protein
LPRYSPRSRDQDPAWRTRAVIHARVVPNDLLSAGGDLKRQSQDRGHVAWARKYHHAGTRADRGYSSGAQCDGLLFFRDGNPRCKCARAPEARHGPYYPWGTSKRANSFTGRSRASQLRAIANYRKARKLIKAWEVGTECLMDTETMQLWKPRIAVRPRSLDGDAPRSKIAGLRNGPTPRRVN